MMAQPMSESESDKIVAIVYVIHRVVLMELEDQGLHSRTRLISMYSTVSDVTTDVL
jgi:hypothetical protein